MTREEIELLFDRLCGKYGLTAQDAKEVFVRLVDTTLRYRDTLVAAGEEALTVEETQQALDIFVQVAIERKRWEGELSKRVQDLVHLWIDEIKPYTVH